MSTYPPPGGYGGYASPPPQQPQTSSKAIMALVFAILAWTTCPIVLAIPALIFAGQAKREIETSNGWVTGEGFVTASRVMGWINLGLWGLFALAMLVFFVIAIIFGETTDTISDVTTTTTPLF